VGKVTWGQRRQRYRAKVQIGAVLLCKGGRGGAARGHAGMGTSGQGEETREARRLTGSVDQNIREYRVWSIEYREMQKVMVTGDGHGADTRTRGPEDTRP
jgi:hypothetical protein